MSSVPMRNEIFIILYCLIFRTHRSYQIQKEYMLLTDNGVDYSWNVWNFLRTILNPFKTSAALSTYILLSNVALHFMALLIVCDLKTDFIIVWSVSLSRLELPVRGKYILECEIILLCILKAYWKHFHLLEL